MNVKEELVAIKQWFNTIRENAITKRNANGILLSSTRMLEEIALMAKDASEYIDILLGERDMKKIMFNDRYGLTKAVLEGRKTMTRRIVPECKELDILRHWEHNEGAIATGYEEHTHSFRIDYCPDKKRRTSIDHLNLIPSYQVGEVVAVAQSYNDSGWNPNTLQQTFVKEPTVFPDLDPISPLSGWIDLPLKYHKGWSNKMFVSADLMPHQIRITHVKVERLHDISPEDCVKEGIGRNSDIMNYPGPREAFAALIDKVSGNGTWERNPWVFVYEFELVK